MDSKVKLDYKKFEQSFGEDVRDRWYRDLKTAASMLPYPLREMCGLQIEGQCFRECPGGISRHHAYIGGLSKHTLEVVLLSSTLARGLSKQTHDNVVCAAFFHDLGKKIEYGWDEEGCWQTIEGKMLRHIPESYHCFRNWASQFFMPWDRQVQIGHMILAHHGRPEWRTPAEPYTMGAQILHLADMASCHAMTDEERDEQRISFAYGNAKLHNPLLTREKVEKAATPSTTDFIMCDNPSCDKCNGARVFPEGSVCPDARKKTFRVY